MAEVHVLGQLSGASEFSSTSLFCKWTIECDKDSGRWQKIEGMESGQTQVDHAPAGEMSVWSHPIDVHYKTTSLQGWPKMLLQVWQQDSFGRTELAGYGFCYVPSSPGIFDLDCPCWRPTGDLSENIYGFFLGGTPHLKHPEIVSKPDDRYRLRTEATGNVHVRLHIIVKGFAKFGVVK